MTPHGRPYSLGGVDGGGLGRQGDTGRKGGRQSCGMK